MATNLRLLCVFAHPDDESFGLGSLLPFYAAQNVKCALVCATRGERGWSGPAEANPGLEALGRIREAELRAAAVHLGLNEVKFLDYIDGDVDQADPAEAQGRIVRHIRRLRPHVVITFDPFGAYGHVDHIAISQLTTAAVTLAADWAYRDIDGASPHRVSKLYYLTDTPEIVDTARSLGIVIEWTVDGVTRPHTAWPDWAITTVVTAEDYVPQARRAIDCHQSQIAGLPLGDLPDEAHRRLWGHVALYRAFSTVNGGRARETDLFEGLRPIPR